MAELREALYRLSGMWPSVSVAALLAGVLAGCSLGGGHQASPSTSLKVAFGPDDGSVGLVVYRLDCGPPGGSFPDPRGACAKLDQEPALVTPPPASATCGGTAGAWAVTITGTFRGQPVDRTFGTCDSHVSEWMKITNYAPCPGNFIDFQRPCNHGPYAFGKAHMRYVYPAVPNVVGMTASQARRTLRLRGLEAAFTTPYEPTHQVVTQSPKPGTSATVYQPVKLVTS